MADNQKPVVTALTRPDLATRQLREFLSNMAGFLEGNALARNGLGYSIDKAIADTIATIDGTPANGRKSHVKRIEVLVATGVAVIDAALKMEDPKPGDTLMTTPSSRQDGRVLTGTGDRPSPDYTEAAGHAELASQVPFKGKRPSSVLGGAESRIGKAGGQ